jgi:hypothetical protein
MSNYPPPPFSLEQDFIPHTVTTAKPVSLGRVVEVRGWSLLLHLQLTILQIVNTLVDILSVAGGNNT